MPASRNVETDEPSVDGCRIGIHDAERLLAATLAVHKAVGGAVKPIGWAARGGGTR